jgi:hypothetical protein
MNVSDIIAGAKLERYSKLTVPVREKIVLLAYCFLGIREYKSTNTGYWIDKFSKELGMSKIPWCMAYVQYVIKRAHVPDILPYNSPSTQAVADWAESNEATVQAQDFGLGDIVIWRNGKNSRQGHTGIITEIVNRDDGLYIETIEGNTSDANYRDGGYCVAKSWKFGNGKNGMKPLNTRYIRCVIGVNKLMENAK